MTNHHRRLLSIAVLLDPSEACSRLYRRRFLQLMLDRAASFKIYKIIGTSFHISVNFPDFRTVFLPRLQISAQFRSISRKEAAFVKF